MAGQKIKIRLDGPGEGSVEIDGKTIEGLTRVQLFAGVGEATRLRLEVLVLGEIEVEGVAEFEIAEAS